MKTKKIILLKKVAIPDAIPPVVGLTGGEVGGGVGDGAPVPQVLVLPSGEAPVRVWQPPTCVVLFEVTGHPREDGGWGCAGQRRR